MFVDTVKHNPATSLKQTARLGSPDRDDAYAVAQKVLISLYSALLPGQPEIKIGASLGISCFPDHAADAEMLMKQADSAMCHGKNVSGKHIVVYGQERI